MLACVKYLQGLQHIAVHGFFTFISLNSSMTILDATSSKYLLMVSSMLADTHTFSYIPYNCSMTAQMHACILLPLRSAACLLFHIVVSLTYHITHSMTYLGCMLASQCFEGLQHAAVTHTCFIPMSSTIARPVQMLACVKYLHGLQHACCYTQSQMSTSYIVTCYFKIQA